MTKWSEASDLPELSELLELPVVKGVKVSEASPFSGKTKFTNFPELFCNLVEGAGGSKYKSAHASDENVFDKITRKGSS